MARTRQGRRSAKGSSVEQLEPRLLLAADATSDSAGGVGIGSFASEDAYAAWVVEAAVERWDGFFGRPAYGYGPGFPLDATLFFERHTAAAGELAVPQVVTDPVAIGADADASTTNTQVAGVDEADLVETDGEKVYTLAEGRLSIVGGIDASPTLLTQVDLPARERAVGMFLSGSRLTVLTASMGARVPDAWQPIQSALWRRFTESPHATVMVLDVSEPSAVEVVSRTRVDGELVASRMVDGQLRLVMNHRFDPPMPEVLPLADAAADRPTVPSGERASDAPQRTGTLPRPPWRWLPDGVYETQAAYVDRVADELVVALQPRLYRLDSAGVVTSVEPLVAATAVDIPEQLLVSQLTTVTAIDVAAAASPVASVGLLTAGETEVFVSASSVYVFDGHDGVLLPPGVPGIATWSEIMLWEPPSTDVARIDVSAGELGVDLAALGSFEGTLLNRFAVGEQDGFLRAVVQQRADGHGVVVLAAEGASLEVVGSLGGIAADEQLYAARIVDDRAYFVTFRFTDPLFVVDLTEPAAPTLLGELHVPGYSDHLQPLDGNLLLAIGRDADERTGMFLGLQLSLFDVSTPESPALLHRYTFDGGRGASTPITGNRWRRGDGDPLAMGFFPERGVVTIPVTREGSPWWWGEPIAVMPQPGPGRARVAASEAAMLPPPPKQTLEVVGFDVHGGITPLGSIDHAESIQRSLRLGDRLVAVSASELSVHDFADPATTLATLRLDDRPRVPVGGRPAAAVAATVAGLLEQGFPLRGAWAVQAIDTTAGEEIAYATHASGAVHRLTRLLGDDAWAGFAFERVRNLESPWLSPEARGRAAPLVPSGEPVAIPQLVSDAILEKLGLARDADGRLVPAGGDSAAG